MRPALTIIAAAAALLLLSVGTALPQSRIVIWGPASGTHLRLSMDDSKLIVEGPLANRDPLGCHRSGNTAVCPLDDVGSIEIDAGPADDKVTVLDHLPVPLTVYLGRGSDKLIGNAERDTCYTEGTARNRCIGNGGDDTCISAPVNTDCVGGPGNDYCETQKGSDGCWGGPGRDVCVMGHGQDGCHGDAGNDRLYGGAGNDQLYGGAGFDYCDGGPGIGHSHNCEAGPRR